jgi:hypothetical protein
MKTYQEYMDIIRERERKAYEEEHNGHDHTKQFCVTDSTVKMSVDYSVEIMGMMLQDFLKEFQKGAK